jgi:hypothetical protein
MRKWILLGVILIVSFAWYYLAQLGVSLRKASFVGGIKALKVARAEYEKFGSVTNYPSSQYGVVLSSKVIEVDGTEYSIFAEVTGGYGWKGGTLVITTNGLFIWKHLKRPPKLVSLTNQPPAFFGPY